MYLPTLNKSGKLTHKFSERWMRRRQSLNASLWHSSSPHLTAQLCPHPLPGLHWCLSIDLWFCTVVETRSLEERPSCSFGLFPSNFTPPLQILLHIFDRTILPAPFATWECSLGLLLHPNQLSALCTVQCSDVGPGVSKSGDLHKCYSLTWSQFLTVFAVWDFLMFKHIFIAKHEPSMQDNYVVWCLAKNQNKCKMISYTIGR